MGRNRPLLIAVLCALPAAVAAVAQLGRLHPDEVFQFLEPANHAAFGTGVLAWEWKEGLRNWAVPGLFAGLLKACGALGLDHPQLRRAVCELPQLALHVAMLLAAFRFTARRLPGREVFALWAMPLLGLTGLVLHFAGRTLSESLSAAFLVWALERLDAGHALPLERERTRAAFIGGALLGCAVVTRYGSLVPVAAAGLLLLAARRWRDSVLALAGGLSVALLLGLLDRLTWGHWFHSLRAYVDFNVLSGKGAEQFGTLPVAFYLQFWAALVAWAWPGVVAGLARRVGDQPRVWWFVAPALAYFAAIAATPHKEARFLYPGLVLLEVAALPAWVSLLERVRAWRFGGVVSAAGLALSLGAGLAQVPGLARYGSGPDTLAPQRTDVFHLWVKASAGATGLISLTDGMWGTPGFFYLAKPVPWAQCDDATQAVFREALADPRYNRAVSLEGRGLTELQAAGFTVRETLRDTTLLVR